MRSSWLIKVNLAAGHLITDVSACEIYLQQEYQSIAQKEEAPLIEEIGSGMVRVHLAALQKAGILPQLLAQAFIASANEKRGSAQNFQKKLVQLAVWLCREFLVLMQRS